jgi:hypothetical protein
MTSQYTIEKAAGIDQEVAKYMMNSNSAAAKNAMALLKLCVDGFDHASFGLLTSTVAECKIEIETEKLGLT